MNNKQELNKATKIGFLCVGSYLVSYVMRNLLGVLTPEMLGTGLYTKALLAKLSSTYMLIYALGQLVNGVVGDKIKPKYMVSIGLAAAGTVSIVFSFAKTSLTQTLLFAVLGFALSMLRGPLVKTISENMLEKYARVCCVFLTVVSSVGPLMASLLALLFKWDTVFIVAGTACIAMSVFAFIALSVLEKKGIISVLSSVKVKDSKNPLAVFKLDNFIFYMIVGALVEISYASISFWLPTYLSEHLGFGENTSNFIFSAISFMRALTPFGALVIFKYFKGNSVRMTKYSFIVATLFFVGVFFAGNKFLNIIFLLIALVAVSCASALLWSIYIPSQAKSGLTSTVNGVLDFSGYFAASAVNLVSANVVTKFGWSGAIIMWTGLMAIGIIASLFTKNKTVSEEVTVE